MSPKLSNEYVTPHNFTFTTPGSLKAGQELKDNHVLFSSLVRTKFTEIQVWKKLEFQLVTII